VGSRLGIRLSRDRTPVAIALGVTLALLTAYAVVIFGSLGGGGLQDAMGRWAYDAVLLLPASIILLRAGVMRDERRAWLFLGTGLLMFALGQTYYSVVLYYADPAPFPSPADAFFLAMYPAIFVAFSLLLRSRAAGLEPLAWLDGVIGALAVAAVAAALIFPPVLDALGGSTLGVAVSLAYPCMDLVLLGLIAGAYAAAGRRSDRAWRLLALALLLFGASDVVYLSVGGQSTEALDIASVGWPLAFLLLASAAWLRAPAKRSAEAMPRRSIALPIALATAVIALLASASFLSVGAVAVVLGAASLAAVLGRLAITFKQNTRMLESIREEASTDELTGLGNRRALMVALDRAFAAHASGERILVIFDLDGFKTYNDSFGHPAGDALLRRLGAQLATAVKPYGTAYRLGGDEFCLLASTEKLVPDAIAIAAEAALTDRGKGFSIGASWGMVQLRSEAADPTAALRAADRRMYSQKGQRADSVLSQTRGVLLGVLREREPTLDRHLHGVAHLASLMAARLELGAEQRDVVVRAAELHDIGKMAIPDSVLHKSGPLSDDEWELMRRHTIIGQRVLDAAPAMSEVARIVRSTHEHWDGSGYPDGLSREQIPLGARVILICDAYIGMIEARPYRQTLTPDEAVAELGRCAGIHFDPDLVETFIQVLDSAEVSPAGSTASAD
jgi:diguanylate cyclase (GGDEF)-like protein/putative nucleotidyltransferase with HDIG domain